MKNLSLLVVVTVGLIITLVTLVVFTGLLLLQGSTIPGTLETLIGMIITGLLGILAPSRTAATPIEDVDGRHEA